LGGRDREQGEEYAIFPEREGEKKKHGILEREEERKREKIKTVYSPGERNIKERNILHRAEQSHLLLDLGEYHGHIRLKGEYRDCVLAWERQEEGEKKRENKKIFISLGRERK
jgi:hypothetical protein